MSKIAFIISRNGVINLVLDGNNHTIPTKYHNYLLLFDALKQVPQDVDKIRRFVGLTPEAAIVEEIAQNIGPHPDGKITINRKLGLVYYNGEELPISLQNRMLDLMRNGHGSEGFKAFVKFCGRLMANPSRNSVQQAYKFVDDNSLPITPEGFVLCYKAVRNDYTDKCTGKVDNSIGAKPFMPRNQVDDDPLDACSYGFHVGTKSFVDIFGNTNDRYIICKIDPADIVCVPHANVGKVRVNTYEVVRDMEGRENFVVMEGGFYNSKGGQIEPTEIRKYPQFDNDIADHWELNLSSYGE